MPEPMPVVRGTLDILVLKTLSWGPMHGPEIIAWLEERSGGRVAFDDSALLAWMIAHDLPLVAK